MPTPVPQLFRRPPKDRRPGEIKEVKALCDKYYRNPPVTEDEILNGRLHIIYIINIDEGKVIEMDVDSIRGNIELVLPTFGQTHNAVLVTMSLGEAAIPGFVSVSTTLSERILPYSISFGLRTLF